MERRVLKVLVVFALAVDYWACSGKELNTRATWS
jgi:hypothetical protein